MNQKASSALAVLATIAACSAPLADRGPSAASPTHPEPSELATPRVARNIRGPLRFQLVKRLDGEVALFRLRRHVALVRQGGETAAPEVLVFDGARVLPALPLPDKARWVRSMVGDWPDNVDILAVGREPVGEATLGTLSFEWRGTLFTEQPGRWLIAQVDGRTATAELLDQAPTRPAFRALRGTPLPMWTRTPLSSVDCPTPPITNVAVAPLAIAPWRQAGLAAFGQTCDGQLGVELFQPGGGAGSVSKLPIENPLIESPQGTLLSIGNELWVITRGAIAHYDGAKWDAISLPKKTTQVLCATLSDEGDLWLSDDGSLHRRSKDGAYTDYGRPSSGERVDAIAASPSGGVVISTDAGFYKVAPEATPAQERP